VRGNLKSHNEAHFLTCASFFIRTSFSWNHLDLDGEAKGFKNSSEYGKVFFVNLKTLGDKTKWAKEFLSFPSF
jgi:hypothetical protein